MNIFSVTLLIWPMRKNMIIKKKYRSKVNLLDHLFQNGTKKYHRTYKQDKAKKGKMQHIGPG